MRHGTLGCNVGIRVVIALEKQNKNVLAVFIVTIYLVHSDLLQLHAKNSHMKKQITEHHNYYCIASWASY